MKMHKWECRVQADNLYIDNFRLRAGEVGRFNHLIGMAGSMYSMPKFPDQIGDDTFIVIFKHDNTLKVLRKEESKNSLNIEFNDIDSLIQAANDLISISVDKKLLRPQPRSTGNLNTRSPDIIEGKI